MLLNGHVVAAATPKMIEKSCSVQTSDEVDSQLVVFAAAGADGTHSTLNRVVGVCQVWMTGVLS
jgi:hypothetical protein